MGRAKRIDEQKLIDALTPYHDEAIAALGRAVNAEQGWAIKIFMEYFYGKPKEKIDVTTNVVDMPVINISIDGNLVKLR